MKKHYSEEYSVRTLIENYCTEEWKFLIKENEERIKYESKMEKNMKRL